jgi:hypothetical protein
MIWLVVVLSLVDVAMARVIQWLWNCVKESEAARERMEREHARERASLEAYRSTVRQVIGAFQHPKEDA